MKNLQRLLKRSLVPALLILISACSGGSSTVVEDDAPVAALCVTSDINNVNNQCGTLLLGLTDADGDFLTYQVEVSGIELVRADGTRVSVLPTSQTVDFVEYIELSELATAATIPVGIYTAGSITVNYSNANIQVEKDGMAAGAIMVDESGGSVDSLTLGIEFDANNRLVIARNRPALLEIDFDLAASHSVDLTTDPVTVTTEPFIVAEVDPITEKEFRMRGPLIEVDEAESNFRIAVRPFYRSDQRFGGVNIYVDDETSFDIDGVLSEGEEGLAQLAQLSAGTATVSYGEFNRDEGRFTATIVKAGSSVPGSQLDAARGVIVAREGSTLTVRGASLIRADRDATFRDEVTVIVAETTSVAKPRRIDQTLTIDDLSVGQAVTVLGEIQQDDVGGTTLDASEGFVRMRLTATSGHVNAFDGSELALNMQALQGRLPEVYDFSGTGIDPGFDADAENYQISTDNLMVTGVNESDPVRVTGFVTPFGSAPADFEAATVINYAQSRSRLYIDWPDGDDVVALSELTSQSLTINIVNDGEGGTYKLIQGGIRTSLTSFDGAVVVEPIAERGLFTMRTSSSVQIFSNFADFSAELQQKLDEGQNINVMHASGGFSNQTLIFKAAKVAVRLSPAEES